MAKVGRTWSRLTVRVTPVPMLPAASVAVGVIVFVPGTRGMFAVQVVPETKTALPLAPPPSALDHPTLTTPEALAPGSEALKVTATGVEFRMFGDVGFVIDTVGAVRSTLTVMVFVAMFPTLSVAVTVITWGPETTLIADAEVQLPPTMLAGPLVEFPAFGQVTEVMVAPRLADTVPLRVTWEPLVL